MATCISCGGHFVPSFGRGKHPAAMGQRAKECWTDAWPVVGAQIDAVFSDLKVNAVKIGMLSVPAAIVAVAAGLDRWQQTLVVLDPVMVATSGDRLLAPEAIEVLKHELIPRVLLITPFSLSPVLKPPSALDMPE